MLTPIATSSTCSGSTRARCIAADAATAASSGMAMSRIGPPNTPNGVRAPPRTTTRSDPPGMALPIRLAKLTTLDLAVRATREALDELDRFRALVTGQETVAVGQ